MVEDSNDPCAHMTTLVQPKPRSQGEAIEQMQRLVDDSTRQEKACIEDIQKGLLTLQGTSHPSTVEVVEHPVPLKEATTPVDFLLSCIPVLLIILCLGAMGIIIFKYRRKP